MLVGEVIKLKMELLISKTHLWCERNNLNWFQFCLLCYWILSVCFCAVRALEVGGGWSHAVSS